MAIDNPDPKVTHFLTDLATEITFPFQRDQFPTYEDAAAWLDINRATFLALRRRAPIQSVELLRLWREAQALLLGFICQDAHIVPFLQEIDALVRGARRLSRRGDLGISGDLFWKDDAVSGTDLLELLGQLRAQIASFRSQQLLHFIPGEPARHPLSDPTWMDESSSSNGRLRKRDSDLEIAFRRSMMYSEEVTQHFSGDLYVLEKAAVCLEQTFRAFAADFARPELGHCWNHWLSVQAWLFWQYKGAPQHQGSDGMLDDSMQAKRYLGFLVADDVLGRTLRSNGCVRHLLNAERVHYLMRVTVEEFLRTKAYFFYLARTRFVSDWRYGRRDKEDYSAAEEFLYGILRVLFDLQREQRCLGCGGSFAESLKAVLPGRDIAGGIAGIVAAKRAGLVRLGVHGSSWSVIDQGVEPLYRWLSDGAEGPAPQYSVGMLCRHFGVMNMFEFLLMCLVARQSVGNHYTILPEAARKPAREWFERELRSGQGM